MLNPQWLRSFTLLAEVGSFTRTAEQLKLTQAAVSQHINHLEQQLGPLLIRRTRQIDLTPAGHSLLAYCAELEQAGQRLTLRLSGGEQSKGQVSLVTPGSSGLFLYPLLLELQSAHPGLAIHHKFAPDTDVLNAVLNNEYEIGLLSTKPDNPHVAVNHFAQEPLELVTPAGATVNSWQDLQRLGFIDHPDGRSMATRILSRAYPNAGGIRDIPVHGFINQVGLILEPVARGLGFTVLPRYARKAFVRNEAISVAEFDYTAMDTLWLIHRAEWPLSARAKYALDHLKQKLVNMELM